MQLLSYVCMHVYDLTSLKLYNYFMWFMYRLSKKYKYTNEDDDMYCFYLWLVVF